jgi:hypothetical protein
MPLIRDTPPGELSPYLLQHQENPVDWYLWGDEAFAAAAALDRPIFLSIGYSACHWCHVMAHESFEDPDIADTLNAGFVSIKVDREERPDVDAVYMEAVQAMTGSGGWPMTVFLTPDRRPFFGGTYFPPEDRPGMPSFTTVLHALTDVWVNRRADVDVQADELASAVASRSVLPVHDADASALDAGGDADGLLALAVDELHRRFDPEWGGFGAAPKFPQPSLIDLTLLRALTLPAGPSREAAEAMAIRTLDAMAAGGMHDHLGGGFARYATDRRWLVPHFEKMLYDQAGLLRSYLHGWQVTGDARYLEVVDGIATYVLRDLTTEHGAVHAAEDADSEGVEGLFYTWTPDQVADVDPVNADAVRAWFAVTTEGNFEGASILYRPVGAPLTGPVEVEAGRRHLLAARCERIRPGLDDKVLTEWNAMWASALAEAAGATGNDGWTSAAIATGEFLWENLRDPDGRWLRSWQAGGGARIAAFAADHAWLVDCFTRLGELTGEARWTERALDVAHVLIDYFGDPAEGGFFTVAADAEQLIVRTKDVFDGATPSANAVAALALTRLGMLTGDERCRTEARRVMERIGGLLPRHPTAFAHSLQAAYLLGRGGTEVVIVGDRRDLVDEYRRTWRPGAVLAWGESTGSPLWAERPAGAAYVCHGFTCLLPASDAATLATQLLQADRPTGWTPAPNDPLDKEA